MKDQRLSHFFALYEMTAQFSMKRTDYIQQFKEIFNKFLLRYNLSEKSNVWSS